MKNRSASKKFLIAGIILALCFVAGVPAIVLGFVNGIIAIGVGGIILTVAGFYGTPLAFVAYGDRIKVDFVVRQIRGGVREIEDLSSALGCKDRQTLQYVRKALSGGYLDGFVLFEDRLLIDKRHGGEFDLKKAELRGNMKSVKCEACGASVSVQEGKQSVCPYCGTYVK